MKTSSHSKRSSVPAGSNTCRHALAGLLLLALTGCSATPSATSLILIVVDTLRYDHLGSYGYPLPTSPELDRFAEHSIRMERAYATASWTRPSTASILTGVHPRTHGATRIASPISDNVATLAEILAQAGYASAGVVSNAHLVAENGFARGFDRYDDSQIGDHEHISSTAVTDLALSELDWLTGTRKPFFLLVHYFDPHFAYRDHDGTALAPTKGGRLNGRESMRQLEDLISTATEDEVAFLVGRYDEEIRHTDAEIGRLLHRIDERGLHEHTVTAITADHGEEFGDHGRIGHGQLYEEVLRVPLLIRVPNLPPRTVAQSVSLVALVPTFLELLNLNESMTNLPPFPEPSFADQLRGIPREAKRTHFAESMNARAAIRGRFKWIQGKGKNMRLFDLEADPAERRNLARRRPKLAASLRGALHHFVRTTQVHRSKEKTLSPEQRELLEKLGYVDEES